MVTQEDVNAGKAAAAAVKALFFRNVRLVSMRVSPFLSTYYQGYKLGVESFCFLSLNDYDNQLETVLHEGKNLTLLLDVKHATKFVAPAVSRLVHHFVSETTESFIPA